jgi:5-methylcytosine-specific restriction endonuclease McrA
MPELCLLADFRPTGYAKFQKHTSERNNVPLQAERKRAWQKEYDRIRNQRPEVKAKTNERNRLHPEWKAKWEKNHPVNRNLKEAKRRTRKTQAGGYFTPEEWFTLCFAVGFKCLCCGDTVELEADHVLSVAKGGTSWLHNIQPLCKPCNSRKRDNYAEYRWEDPSCQN